MSLVTLEEWAAEHFRTPPSANTLRKWAREGSITPRPVKHGRSYYVDQDATYEAPEAVAKVPLGGSLISRIASASHGAQAA